MYKLGTFNDLKLVKELTYRALNQSGVKKWTYGGGYNAENILLPIDTNLELVELLNMNTGYSKKDITSVHYIKYSAGTSLQKHRDEEMLHIRNAPNSETYIVMLSMCEEGGELLLEDTVCEFNSPGQTISFDGRKLYHEVKEVKKGQRETLVVWYKTKVKKSLF